MQKRIHFFGELYLIFKDVIKWFLYAVLVGVVVGGGVVGFLKLLDLGINLVSQIPNFFLLLPIGLFFSALIVYFLAPEARGHGTERVIRAVHTQSGKIPWQVVPVKLLATVITISVGGSAGKEGPAAQIGAGLASLLSDMLKLKDEDRKKLVICSVSAGFSAVFGTPIAGAIFGIEVLYVGNLMYELLFPSLVAGIVSYEIASSLGITYMYKHIIPLPQLSTELFLIALLGGIFFGLVGLLFIEVFRSIEKISNMIKVWRPFKGIIGGIILVVLTILVGTEHLGLGVKEIARAIKGEEIGWFTPLWKILATSITLGFEGSGGVVTPIFFVGSTSGNVFARLLGLDRSLFSAIGMMALLAGMANTPLSASIMAVELFGSQIAPLAVTASIVSFLITGHRSIYPSQILAISKTSAFKNIPKGAEIKEVEEMVAPAGITVIIEYIKDLLSSCSNFIKRKKTSKK